MKKNSWIDRLIFLAVIGFSIFFAIYRILDIPPGTQDDVLRSVITAQQYLLHLDGGFTGIRQIIAYYVLGGYWSQYLIDLARGYQNVEAMLIISRLPAALFFIFGTVIWYKTLVELGLKRIGIITFFAIFLPSSYFINYSHHIPLVAGYFFYASAGSYFLLKFVNSKELKFRYLLLSTLAFGLSTYTHGISIFYIAAFLSIFLGLTLVLRGKDLKRLVLNIFRSDWKKSIFKYIIVIIVFLAALFPFVDGLIFSDNSIKTRDANTINYLIENNEVELFKTKLLEKYKAYFNWNTLILSGDIVPGEQPTDSTKFYDIKNPQFNQWVTTNLSPFGFISIVAYLALFTILIKLFQTREYKYIFALTLFLSFIVVIFPTNYDNPSIAKVIVPILFIPLSIAILFDELSKDKEHAIFGYVFIIFALINANFNLTYLYSPNYPKNETKKYYMYTYDKVYQEIISTAFIPKMRVFLPANNKGAVDLASFYLSSYGLNRTVFGDFRPELINFDEFNYFVSEDPTKFDPIINITKNLKIIEFYDENTNKTIYLGELLPNNTKDHKVIKSSDTLCGNFPIYPERTGERELTLYQYRYYNTKSYFVEDCTPQSQKFNSIDSSNFILDANKLVFKLNNKLTQIDQIVNQFGEHKVDIIGDKVIVDLDENQVATTKQYQLITKDSNNIDISDKSKFTFSVGEAKKSLLLKISNINPIVSTNKGTYILEFEYDIDKYGYLDFYGTDVRKPLALPVSPLKQNFYKSYDGKYRTIFYLTKGAEYIFTFTLNNDHFNLDKDKHQIAATIKNIKLTRVSSDNVTGLKLNLPQTSSPTDLKEGSINQIFPGIYRLNLQDGETEKIFLLNRFFTKFVNTESMLVNGVGTGVYVDKQIPKYWISESLVYGTGILLSNIILMGMFTVFNGEKEDLNSKENPKV